MALQKMSDLYKPTIGQMEQIFRTHNAYQNVYADRDRLSALPYHLALELVEKNLWETEKKKYIVVLPALNKFKKNNA